MKESTPSELAVVAALSGEGSALAQWQAHRPSPARERVKAYLRSLKGPLAARRTAAEVNANETDPLDEGEDATSVVGMEIVRQLVQRSQSGRARDPVVPVQLLLPELPEGRALDFALLSLGFAGFLGTDMKTGGHTVWPTEALFECFDGAFRGTDPYEDAAAVARVLVDKIGVCVSTEDLSDALEWTPRRLNPALNILLKWGFVERAAADAAGVASYLVKDEVDAFLAAAEGRVEEVGSHARSVTELLSALRKKFRTQDLPDMADAYCLSARLKADGSAVLGLFTAGEPEWASNTTHEYYRADTVFLAIGTAIQAIGGETPSAEVRAQISKDRLLRQLAKMLAEALNGPVA